MDLYHDPPTQLCTFIEQPIAGKCMYSYFYLDKIHVYV